MNKYILETSGGDTFDAVAKKAIKTSSLKKCVVEFDFNGVKCLVKENTNLDWLYRDYSNSFLMEWAEIGPDYSENYSKEVQVELKNRQDAAGRKNKIREEKWREEERIKKDALEKRIAGIELEISDVDGWVTFQNNNQDPYGGAVVKYAENWAKLMQAEMKTGKTLEEVADQCSHDADTEGITGFMYGCAVNVLFSCWRHGEQLKKWHNKQYNHEGEGVVNPAILTIPS